MGARLMYDMASWFGGTCDHCRGRFCPGDRVTWRPPTMGEAGRTFHVTCPPCTVEEGMEEVGERFDEEPWDIPF